VSTIKTTTTHDDVLLRELGARFRERDFDEDMANRIAARILAKPEHQATRPRVLRFGRMQAFAAPLAIAAAIVLYLGTRPANDPPLPEYTMSIVSAKSARGDVTTKTTPEEVTLDPNGDLELVLRPAIPTHDVSANATLVRDNTTRPWAPPMEVSTDGAIRIAGRNQALFPETRGSYELVVAVGKQTLRARVRFVE
jgi:hypothetical protein